MRRDILNGKQIMNMEFQLGKMEPIHFHQAIEILYILEGNPEISIQNDTFQAHPEDILVINANKKHSYQSTEDVLLAYFEIDYRLLGDMLDTNQILFWCNSVMNKNAAYDDMRSIMKQILSLYFEKGGQTQIVLQSLYFQLLEVLIKNFFVKSGDKRFEGEQNQTEDRIAEIINYIHGNYKRKISLNELSSQLYLSVPYLSKYIKKQLGMNFLDYLNNIRIFHAVDDLLYTRQPITTIALDNGFANTAAFTDVFKKIYNMTPSEYRQQMFMMNEKQNVSSQDEQDRIVEQKITDYLDKKLIVETGKMQTEDAYALVDTTKRKYYNKYWNQMINIGKASDLLRSDLQEQILILKNELGFSYVRIWDLFAKELMLNEDDREGKYYFGRLDKILDFLIEHGIRPYLELGIKPNTLHRNLKKTIVNEEREIPFGGLESYERFMQALSTHVINRYGIEEVEEWYFEQWCGENFENASYDSSFYIVFDMIAQAWKKHSPNVRIGGGGIGIQYGSRNLAELVGKWAKKTKYKPDFISLYCYPYIRGDEDGTEYAIQSTDRDFLVNQYEMAETVIRTSAFSDVKIHISEWTSTISNRNILNDSCFKGAYIVKSILDCFEKTEVLGYWHGSDIFAEHMDNQKLLFGGCGLLNVQGIKKPSFYAYRFLNQLGKYVIYKDDNGIVTTNGNKNYSIVCHNYRHLSYKYYLKAEDELDSARLSQLYEDNQSCQLNYRLSGVANGTYKIKTYLVSPEHGSILEELQRLGESTELTKVEVDYVKRVATPRIQIRHCQVTNGVLNFETRMVAQEIQYIHISYLYE